MTGTGWVALVGGGPGVDGLITARGAELLSMADVVVMDRLAPRGLTRDLGPDVELIDVGKEVGSHAVTQTQINRILIDKAGQGHGVVRLKGGDPYVLGRGMEEHQACAQAGIPVEVVSGVTSAIAVPAAAGIPLTHRGVARAFTVLTGHDAVQDLPPGTDHTVVLLMGVARLAQTMQAMSDTGREPHCPVAVVERGLLPGQRTTVGTVQDIARRAAAAQVSAPAVIVVGDVVRLCPAWSTSHNGSKRVEGRFAAAVSSPT